MATRSLRRLRDLLDVTFGTPADNDVLTYDSGTDKFVLAAASATSENLYRAAKSTTGYVGVTNGSGAGTTAAVTAGTMMVIPCSLRAGTLDRLGITIGTGQSGTVVRMGLYGSDSNGYPSTLIVDGGTVDTSTSGFKTVTISTAISAGLYWFAAVQPSGTAVTVSCHQNDNTMSMFVVQSSAGGSNGGGYIQTGVTGALPSPYGTATNNLTNPIFKAWVRYSA